MEAKDKEIARLRREAYGIEQIDVDTGRVEMVEHFGQESPAKRLRRQADAGARVSMELHGKLVEVKKEKTEVKREEKKKKKKRKRTEEEKEEEEEEEPTSDVENTPPEVSVAPERLAEIKSELKSLFAKYEPVKAIKVNNLLKKYVGHGEDSLDFRVSELVSE